MAYAVEADCRLHAPQAPVGEGFAGHITQADAVVDGRLRTFFEVPFSAPIPQLITNIVSRLAAGRFLEAEYAKINQEPPEFAGDLITGAMRDLDRIVANPAMLGIDQRETTLQDLNDGSVMVSDRERGYFDSTDPQDWGN